MSGSHENGGVGPSKNCLQPSTIAALPRSTRGVSPLPMKIASSARCEANPAASRRAMVAANARSASATRCGFGPPCIACARKTWPRPCATERAAPAVITIMPLLFITPLRDSGDWPRAKSLKPAADVSCFLCPVARADRGNQVFMKRPIEVVARREIPIAPRGHVVDVLGP